MKTLNVFDEQFALAIAEEIAAGRNVYQQNRMISAIEAHVYDIESSKCGLTYGDVNQLRLPLDFGDEQES